jgi:1-deoxy-D-xylulose-5-phosphate synthase
VFADEIVRLGAERDDLVAITAAMLDPVGLGPFAARFPDRIFDVGIAEQHALTSAAGMAAGGLHPVIALYATFLNRAFDQLLMDVALHKAGVTVVLDRAGVTGDDGPSHNGMWDMAMLGIVPGIHIAAPRDERTLRSALAEAVSIDDAPSVIRFPKTALGQDIPFVRTIAGVDMLLESDTGPVDVLIVSVGAMATDVLAAAGRIAEAGYTLRVVDPRWVTPVSGALLQLAAEAALVVTVEDGVVVNGIGASMTATREIGIPLEVLEHGKVTDVRARVGLTPQGISRRTIEFAAAVLGRGDSVRGEVVRASELSSKADNGRD